MEGTDPEIVEVVDEPCIPDEAKDIFATFPVDERRARKWLERVGDVETLQERVGTKGPADLEDRVWERERLRTVRRKWRDSLLETIAEQLRPWYRENRPAAHPLDPEYKAVRSEFERRQIFIFHDIAWSDSAYIDVSYRLAEIDRELVDVYRTHLSNATLPKDTKKARIKELKRAFPYARIAKDLVAIAIGTTRSYVGQVKYVPGEGFRDRQVPTPLRRRTLDRDGGACVRCGATEDLEAHHIIPRSVGGEDCLENMATLCSDCHNDADSGLPTPYADRSEFWTEWAETDPPERHS